MKYAQNWKRQALLNLIRASGGAPAFLVVNHDGSSRMVIDYSRRNVHTLDLSYPCPDLNNALLEFRGKTVLSTLDITKAFYNIKVKEEHKERTAFVTASGSWVFNVMPFGGKRAPATWASASDRAFRGVVNHQFILFTHLFHSETPKLAH